MIVQRLRPNAIDSLAIARFRRLLALRRIELAPGTWFGDKPTVFRLGFGAQSLDDLRRGLAAMSEVLMRQSFQKTNST
jgi:DNA-binding transcriptional MocR family regulator